MCLHVLQEVRFDENYSRITLPRSKGIKKEILTFGRRNRQTT